MGNRLMVTAYKRSEPWFSLYFHWGAEDEWIDKASKAVKTLCKADMSLADNIRAVMKELDMSGLATDPSWFRSNFWGQKLTEDWFEEEFPAVKALLDEGIPKGTDRSAGLVMVTPKTIREAEPWCEWVEDVDL